MTAAALQFRQPGGWGSLGGFALGCLVMVLLLHPAAAAGRDRDPRTGILLSEARDYYWGIGVEQDYRRALELYERAAARGSVEGSYIAGGMYYTGKGTERDPAKAFRYLDYAAARGKSSSDSQRALAQFYLAGSVVPQNYETAASLFGEAADAGDPAAQVELGFLYFVGKGVEQDYKKAFQLFERAALQNNHLAQYNMAIMWYTGNGVERSDLSRAYAWFSIAATNGFADARSGRDYLETVLSPETLEQAQQEATSIYRTIRSRER